MLFFLSFIKLSFDLIVLFYVTLFDLTLLFYVTLSDAYIARSFHLSSVGGKGVWNEKAFIGDCPPF